MTRFFLLLSSTILTFTLGSCGFIPFFKGSQEAQETPQNNQVNSETVASNTDSEEASEAQSFEAPLVAPSPKPPRVASLIASSSAQERVNDVAKGRPDPFALVPVSPGEAVVTVEFDSNQTSGRAPNPTINAPSSVPRVPSPPKVTTPSVANLPPKPQAPVTPPQIPNKPAQRPSNLPGLPKPPAAGAGTGAERFIPELPPLPQPKLAQAVEITGVIDVKGEPHAILKAPNEPFSRYVKAGQYLSNGQVLVKRIEMQGAPEPIVVFEQLGMEISRAVGAPPASLEPEKSTALAPLLPPPPVNVNFKSKTSS